MTEQWLPSASDQEDRDRLMHPEYYDPEPPVNPQEADSKTIERNITNSIRGDCVDALNTLEDRLDELGRLFPDSLRELREELRGEMEE